MKTTIRHKIFETNSSSSHSLSVAHRGNLNIPSPDKDGVLHINPKTTEFGWGLEFYNDFDTKAAYIMVDIKQRYPHDNVVLEEFLEFLKEVTGAKHIDYSEIDFEEEDEGYMYNSYVDHQSAGTGIRLLEDKEEVKRFLFNYKSELEISNDNM